MQLMKRIVAAGLGTMGAVATAAAICPAVAGVVAGLLVTVLCASGGLVVVLGGRRVRAELAWRRQLRTMRPLEASIYGDAAASPTLVQLRESA